MNLKKRYLLKPIQDDLKEKMVFLGGPRQVGKTTFAKEILGSLYPHQYYNWDKITQRRQALKGEWPHDTELIILDEFHKHSKWKSWLKGEYDTFKNKYKFLLTGSARLNVYRKGGDSLQGRYHFHRLHPFSLAEISSSHPTLQPGKEIQFSSHAHLDQFDALLEYGGFPEPYLKQNSKHLRRWNNERIERFFKEDIRDLTRIQDFGNLTLLSELLPERVASILSINALAIDLQVNFRTLANWLNVFENFYFCYRLSPYQSKKIAMVRKEKKLYLWDWSQLTSPGPKLENMIASHLLKLCHYLHDTEGWKITLHYLRDTTGREVDFLVCHEEKPWFAVEVKSDNTHLSKNLLYFREKLKIPYAYQLTLKHKVDFTKSDIRVLSAEKFLSALI